MHTFLLYSLPQNHQPLSSPIHTPHVQLHAPLRTRRARREQHWCNTRHRDAREHKQLVQQQHVLKRHALWEQDSQKARRSGRGEGSGISIRECLDGGQ